MRITKINEIYKYNNPQEITKDEIYQKSIRQKEKKILQDGNILIHASSKYFLVCTKDYAPIYAVKLVNGIYKFCSKGESLKIIEELCDYNDEEREKNPDDLNLNPNEEEEFQETEEFQESEPEESSEIDEEPDEHEEEQIEIIEPSGIELISGDKIEIIKPEEEKVSEILNLTILNNRENNEEIKNNQHLEFSKNEDTEEKDNLTKEEYLFVFQINENQDQALSL